MSVDLLIGLGRGFGPTIPGSAPYPCEHCGGDVLVAPSGQAMIEDGGVVVLHSTCVQEYAERLGGRVAEAMPTPEHLAEVERLRRDLARDN